MLVAVAIALVAFAMARETWRFVGWQNEQRALFGMPAIGPGAWRITSGAVEFYATCQEWGRGNASAQATLIGDYVVSVPAGSYRVRILNGDSESGAVSSLGMST